MLDKKKNNAYIWYSGATDVTGIKLAEALGIKHGKGKPILSKHDLIIGWGTKTKELVSLSKTSLGKMQILNHPNQILDNRDKLLALNTMNKAGVNVASFMKASTALAAIKTKSVTAPHSIKLPLIGRTKYHQGGKGFWMCPTMTHVASAIDEGAGYFQNMIEIKDEYRLHIFGNDLIYAVKKVKRSKEEYKTAYVRHELERQKKLAEKNGNQFNEETAKLILERIAKKKAADGADMIIRSNRLGWKFSHVKGVGEHLKSEAVKAIKALGLNFGAVDCCIDINGNSYIIEVNTGPGLEETPFRAYVDAFKKVINKEDIIVPKKEAKVIIKDGTSTPIKDRLLAKTTLFTELIEKADEDEAKALKSVFSKMFD